MAKRLHSGDLREVFELQESTLNVVLSEETTTWDTVSGCDDVRAKIEYESEPERVRAGRNEGRESIKITTRKDLPATPKNRVLWRSEYFQITGFPQFLDARRMWIRFSAVRTDAD